MPSAREWIVSATSGRPRIEPKNGRRTCRSEQHGDEVRDEGGGGASPEVAFLRARRDVSASGLDVEFVRRRLGALESASTAPSCGLWPVLRSLTLTTWWLQTTQPQTTVTAAWSISGVNMELQWRSAAAAQIRPDWI